MKFVSRVQSQRVAIVTNNNYYSLLLLLFINQAKQYAEKLKFSINCSSFLITQGIIINESLDKRQRKGHRKYIIWSRKVNSCVQICC